MSSGGPDDLNLNSSIFLETDDDLTGGFKSRVNPMKTPQGMQTQNKIKFSAETLKNLDIQNVNVAGINIASMLSAGSGSKSSDQRTSGIFANKATACNTSNTGNSSNPSNIP